MSLQIRIRARRGDFRLEADIASEARVLGLFGRSGSGKSSLADAVAGLLRPDEGLILIDGGAVYDSAAGIDLPAWKRRIGYVFQQPRLFPHLDVLGNLLFGHRPGEGPTLETVAGLLGLEPLLARRPRGLSGGEARRVAIGRALLSAPRLLILDEPLVGLDGARRAELMPHLEALAREGGPPILHITHSVEEATRLDDALVLMAGGRTLVSGPPAEVFDHPEAEAAAGLEAPLSILEGRVAGHGAGGTRVEIGPAGFLAPRLSLQPGERARVVIDARDVALALSNPKDTSVQNRLAMRVSAIETRPTGALVRLAAEGLTLKALVTPDAVERLGLKPGLEVFALVKATAAARRTALG